MKKKLSIIMAIVMCLSAIFSVNIFAATSLPKISSSKPIITYTIKSSGKVYAYTNNKLNKKTGGYIACSTDECKILKISGNAVQVKYPVSGGTKTAWFKRSEFTSYNISKGADSSWTQSSKITTYRRSDGKKSFGYISAGDKCYKLGKKGSYTQVVYPVSGGYKMGWVKTSQIKQKSSSSNKNTSSSYTKKVNAFISDKRWKNGAKWTDAQKPKLSSYTAWGCCAYTADFCKYVFGKSSYRSGKKFSSPKDIKAGDVIKVTGPEHWFVVLERNGNKLKTAEGNWSGKVLVSSSTYTIKNNKLYRSGSPFRKFSAGYHMQ